MADVVGHGLTLTLYSRAGVAAAAQAAARGRGRSPTSTSRWTPACTGSAPIPTTVLELVAGGGGGAVAPLRRALWTHFPVADCVGDEDRAFTDAQLRLLDARPTRRWPPPGYRPPHASTPPTRPGRSATPAPASTSSAAASPCTGWRPSRRSTTWPPTRGSHRRRRPAARAVAARPGGAGAPRSSRPAPLLRPPLAPDPHLDAGDGAPRLRRRRPPALLRRGRDGPHRRPAPPVGGMVTMDQIVVDCGPDDDVAVGDEVVLIGEQGDESLSVSDWADVLGTIAHEVFCGIGPRVPRLVVDREEPADERQATAARSRVVPRRGRRDRRRAGGGLGRPAPHRGPHPLVARRHRGRGSHRPRRLRRAHRRRRRRRAHPRRRARRRPARGPAARVHAELGAVGAPVARPRRPPPRHRPRPARPRGVGAGPRRLLHGHRRPRSRRRGPGRGPSPLAQQGSTAMRRMAVDVRTVLEALEVEHALLVGHSMGGMVALQLAHDPPSAELRRRVAAMALVSTTAGPFTRLPGFGGMARAAGPVSARALGLADRWGVRTLASSDVRWWLTRPGLRGRRLARAGPLRRRSPSGHVAAPRWPSCCPALALFDLSKWLGTLDLPVLVVVGSQRPPHAAPPRPPHRRRRCPHSELVELPRCGHMPMVERRREFARLLEEFAAKLG